MGETTIYFVETEAKDQRSLLCRWVELLYERGRKIQIVTDSTLAAQSLDQQLWTFSDTSFIPHRIFGTGAPQPADLDPVTITIGAVALGELKDTLICDGTPGLEFMRGFELVVHFIIVSDVLLKQESRNLWQAVREQGFGLLHVPQASNAPERNLRF